MPQRLRKGVQERTVEHANTSVPKLPPLNQLRRRSAAINVDGLRFKIGL